MAVLEELRERVRRIGQASGGQGVRPQQVTELVVDSRLRDRNPRQQQKSHDHGERPQPQDAGAAVPAHAVECVQEAVQPMVGEAHQGEAGFYCGFLSSHLCVHLRPGFSEIISLAAQLGAADLSSASSH